MAATRRKISVERLLTGPITATFTRVSTAPRPLSLARAADGIATASRTRLASTAAQRERAEVWSINGVQIAMPAGGTLVAQQVLLADERHFDVSVASADRRPSRFVESHTRNPVEQVDPHRLHTDDQHRLGLAQRFERYSGGLKPESDERCLKAEKILRGIREKDVDVFREPREAVTCDRLASHDHVLNAVALE
jgi:hypothetical protein